MIWRHALILPDPVSWWDWAGKEILGLPALARLLVVLQRTGVREVSLLQAPDEAIRLRRSPDAARDLPAVAPIAEAASLPAVEGPVLCVAGGMLFDQKMLHRLQLTVKAAEAAVVACRGQAAILSASAREVKAVSPRTATLDALIAEAAPEAPFMDAQGFCRSVDRLKTPKDHRALLQTVEKATDRWHVRKARQVAFPLIRWLARHGITPNQVSVAGFLVGAAGCAAIALGGYWPGVLGALLLYASWVLDCVDGTLARLTFTESDFGRRLDTFLGHLLNLLIFGALIWSVYGLRSPWLTAFCAVFVLGGISLARRLIEIRNALPHPESPGERRGRLQSLLDKINHRDYAVVILVLALVNGFELFLWLSLAGIQVFWMSQLALVRRRR